jgi:hypothetical protein
MPTDPNNAHLGLPHPCRVLRDRACPEQAQRAEGVGHSVRTVVRCMLIFSLGCFVLLTACSPRDFLSRRLATDLIAASDSFNAPQQYVLQTGVVSNKEYVSPEYLVLQHHGWIAASNANCPPGLVPSPCWEVMLTPMGVDTVHALLPADETTKPMFAIPVARRQFVAVTGISKQGGIADVDFTWRWVPLNEIGAALYSGDLHYKSTVGFRDYDDGWHMLQSAPHASQTLDDALKNAEPAP